MRVLLIAILLIALVAGAAISVIGEDARVQDDSERANQSGSFLVFRDAVASWASQNPSFSGEVSSTNLPLPPWYTQQPAFRVVMASGYAYVWVSKENAEGGLASEILASAGNSALIGFARGGKLFSPRDGLTAINVPSSIPEEALVYVFPPKPATAGPGPGPACSPAPAAVSESRLEACTAPATGPGWTQTRSIPFASAPAPACWTPNLAAATAWTPTSAPSGACTSPPTCGPAPADYTDSGTAACPNNPANSYSRTRSVTHSSSAHPVCWTESFGAWSGPTATDCPSPPVCGTAPADETQPATCAAGQYGSRTLSASYAAAAHPTCWTLGAYSESANNCVSCPASGYQNLPPMWVGRVDSCPLGQSGTITYEVRIDRRQMVTYSCPAGTASAPSGVSGPVEDTETTVRRNEVNTCVSTCAGTWRWSVMVDAEQSGGGCPSGGGVGPAVTNGSACAEGSPDRMWRTCGPTTAAGTNYWDRTATCVCQ